MHAFWYWKSLFLEQWPLVVGVVGIVVLVQLVAQWRWNQQRAAK